MGQIGISQTLTPSECGTPDLSSYIGDPQDLPVITTRSSQPRYYPIQFHSVGQSDGEGHMSYPDLLKAICILNKDFEEHGIQFFQKDNPRYINNDDYYEHGQSDGSKLMRNHNVRNAFNVYVVNSANENCGYFSPANKAVVVAKFCFISGTHTLTHEMGHFLGLPHTFNGWENRSYDKDNVPRYISIRGRDTLYVETVDGKNCEKAGDMFCDTPPDYINERWNCGSDGLSLKTYVDPKGVEFKVEASNFMSYSQDHCQARFTPDQETRMHQILDSRFSSYEYKFIPPDHVSGTSLSLIEPLDDDEVDFDNIRLQWTETPDATEYIVQISQLPGNLFDKDPNIQILTTDKPEITIPAKQIKIDKKYYWRVIPLNMFTFCVNASEIYSFTPRTKTNTHLLPDGDQIRIYPNIVPANQGSVQLDCSFTSPRRLTIRLMDLNGRIMRTEEKQIMGDVVTRVETGSLPGGMYLLHITDGRSVLTQKLLIQ